MIRRSTLWALVLFLSAALPLSAQEAGELPPFPGQIAFLGPDFNVRLLDGSTGEVVALTDDASARRAAPYVYQWPTWSRGGSLAWFGVGARPGTSVLATDAYVARDWRLPAERVHSAPGESFTYASWGGPGCGGERDCETLGVLLGTRTSLALDLVQVRPESVDARRAGTGSPFYTSWSPDGGRMLWRRANELLIYTLADGATAALSPEAGQFATPAWSPVDDRLLLGARGAGESTDLVILAGDAPVVLAPGLTGGVAFDWSPDGNRVAYVTAGGALVVLDPVAGAEVARSPVAGVLAFFWSPDSARLAFVTAAAMPGTTNARGGSGPRLAAQEPGEVGLLWWAMDAGTGEAARYTTFVPTRDMLYLLTYFDQFARSHRVWSPDSRHLLYAEVTPDGRPVLTLLDVSSAAPVPLTLAEGTIGVWSFE